MEFSLDNSYRLIFGALLLFIMQNIMFEIAGTEETNNLICVIIFTCENFCFSTNCQVYENGHVISFERAEFPLYNKQKNTWMLGNTRYISLVEINLVFSRIHVLIFAISSTPPFVCNYLVVFMSKEYVRGALVNSVISAEIFMRQL